MDLVKQLTLSGLLFFIQYVPDQTIRPRWYLIEVLPYVSTTQVLRAKATGKCKVSYSVRHPDDNSMNDDLERWRTDWYEIIHNDGSTSES